MLKVNNLIGFGSRRSAASISLTYITQLDNTVNQDIYTFTDANIGTAAADRLVIVTVGLEGTGGAITIDSVTIGGNAATQAVQYSAANRTVAGIFYLAVASGTTATIEVDSNGSPQRCIIGVWTLTGYTSATPYDTDSAANSTGGSTSTTMSNLDFPDNSVAVCCAACGEAGAVSWTNATERYDIGTTEGLHRSSGADVTQATATTTLDITLTHPAVSQVLHMVGAVWS